MFKTYWGGVRLNYKRDRKNERERKEGKKCVMLTKNRH
jgi:hypothetical protein